MCENGGAPRGRMAAARRGRGGENVANGPFGVTNGPFSPIRSTSSPPRGAASYGSFSTVDEKRWRLSAPSGA